MDGALDGLSACARLFIFTLATLGGKRRDIYSSGDWPNILPSLHEGRGTSLRAGVFSALSTCQRPCYYDVYY